MEVDRALLLVEQRGSTLAKALLKRELIPFNFDSLLGVKATITRASTSKGLLLLPLPVRLRQEHSLYRAFSQGDVLVVHQLGCIAVVVERQQLESIEAYKAGEVIEGLENLSRLPSGATVTLRITPAERSI
uniref:Cyclophilin TM1367-like domain-containing protein n=1 Tax=Thermofilum pendens TaxID=2269 RepID=A0A7C4FAW4_THEPE